MIKSVGYVAQVLYSDAIDHNTDPQGTGFFVSMPAPQSENRYHAFVTAKHTAKGLEGKEVRFTVNSKRGGVIDLVMASDHWMYHPTDDSVDVAVLPFNLTPELDFVAITVEDFLTPERMREWHVGIGDEVFIPSLFWHAPGTTKRNLPILRHGNIAMLPDPDEPMLTIYGWSHVCLIEARSIAGVSGAPVIVRGTIGVPGRLFGESGSEQVMGLSSRMHLLGLMQGHWDVREDELNNPKIMHDQRGVNLGIAKVVPAQRILETLHNEELLALIEEHEAKARDAAIGTADGAPPGR